MARSRQPFADVFGQAIAARDLYAGGFSCHLVPNDMIGLILGALDSAQYPHVWTGDDYEVALAMAQVRSFIAAFGTPLTLCEAECQDCEETAQNEVRIISGCEHQTIFEEISMSLCGYNPKAFKIEAGELYVRDFCGDWVKIGNLTTVPDDGFYEPDPETDLEGSGVYPCAMAQAYAGAVAEFASYMWDRADDSAPPFIVWDCEKHLNLELNDFYTMQAWNQAMIMKGSVIVSYGALDLEKSDVVPWDMQDYLACSILPLFGQLGEFDKDTVWDELHSAIERRFSLVFSVNNLFIRQYYNHLLQALGKGTLRDVAEGAKFTPGVVCHCQDAVYGPLTPVEGGWYLGGRQSVSMTFTDTKEDSYTYVCSSPDHHVYGIFAWMSNLQVEGGLERWSKSGTPGGCAHDVQMTDHSSTAVYLPTWMDCQMEEPQATLLFDAMEAGPAATGYDKNVDTLGPRSNVINSPILDAALTGQQLYFAVGGPGSVGSLTVHWRYVHNATDSSHTP